MPKSRYFILLGMIIALALLGRVVAISTNSKLPPREKIVPALQQANMDFKEMTIPYLRERDYISSLGALDQIETNTEYTTYLTSYDSDGLKINGLLTIPQGAQPRDGWPAIVFLHGYIPPKEYKTTEKYVDYVDYLARNGYVVFKIDLRGHGDSEGEPGGGYFGSDYVVDTLNAYAALENAEFVDPKTIGLWGHSMSGNTVLRSMVIRPTIPVGVIWAGAVYTYEDLQKYRITDASYRRPQDVTESQKKRQAMFEKYGSPSADSPFWQKVIPTNYVNNMEGSLQVHHAIDDAVVPIEYSTNLVAILDKTDVPHQLYKYETGGHNIEEPSFSIAMRRTVEFFNRRLK